MRRPMNELTDDPILLRILDQLQLQGKTEKSLLEYLGVSTTVFTGWKYKNVKSYIKRIDEIAEYLGVDKEYLLEGSNAGINGDNLTATEVKLVSLFRKMGNNEQAAYMKTGELFVQSSEYYRIEKDNNNTESKEN